MPAKRLTLLIMKSCLMNYTHQVLMEACGCCFESSTENRPTRVKWNNIISEEFNVLQGVRQGGVSSAPVYKSYTNRLLNNLQKHHLGHRIGTVNVSAQTCADDIAILSNSHHDSQAAINVVNDYAASHRYTINASKSATVAFNSCIQCSIGDRQL